MRLLDGRGIVLDVVDLGERDRIATFLTAEHGKKRGVARGARAKYSRFAGQLQPLATAHLRWVEKEGRELVRISDVQLVRPAAPIQTDLEGLLLGSYLAEHLMEFAQEDEPSDAHFRLLDSTIDALLDGSDPDLAARYVEVWVLRLAGLLPTPDDCPLCGRPLGDTAALIESEAAIACLDCAAGQRRYPLGAPSLEFLRASGRRSLAKFAHRGTPSPATLREIEGLALRVRRHFLQGELKSYRVLRTILGGTSS